MVNRLLPPRPSRRHALGAGIALALAPRVIAAQALQTIRVGSSPNEDAAPIVYGQTSGLFRNAGLDVVYQKANSGSAVSAAVAGGALDIGKSSVMPLIGAHARGIPFVIIAASSLHVGQSPDAALTVAAGSPLRSARDLNGEIVSVAGLNDLNWLAVHAWIDANGGDSASVHFIELPGSAVAAALEQGRISAGTMSEPYLTEGIRAGRMRMFGNILNGIAPRLLESAFFTTSDFVGKNRDAVARFAHAIGAASAYCNTHPEETISLVAALTGLERPVIAQMKRTIFAPDVLPGDIQPVIEAAVRYKMISRSFDARELLTT